MRKRRKTETPQVTMETKPFLAWRIAPESVAGHCLFCGQGATVGLMATGKDMAVHVGCLWSEYVRLKQQADERANPGQYALR